MATRYVGDAVVKILFLGITGGRPTYRGTVHAGEHRWAFDDLRVPSVGSGPCSPKAYDRVASDAVSFGAYYTSLNRGDDVPDWAPPANVADAIEEAAMWVQLEDGEYEVLRSPPKSGEKGE